MSRSRHKPDRWEVLGTMVLGAILVEITWLVYKAVEWLLAP